MSSTEMWLILEEFALRFNNRLGLPWMVSVHQQKIKMLPISLKTKMKLQTSLLCLFSHSIFCLFSLYWLWTGQSSIEDDKLELVKYFVLFGMLCLSFGLLAVHFIISFSPEVIPTILNPIPHFQTKLKSN